MLLHDWKSRSIPVKTKSCLWDCYKGCWVPVRNHKGLPRSRWKLYLPRISLLSHKICRRCNGGASRRSSAAGSTHQNEFWAGPMREQGAVWVGIQGHWLLEHSHLWSCDILGSRPTHTDNDSRILVGRPIQAMSELTQDVMPHVSVYCQTMQSLGVLQWEGWVEWLRCL